MNINYIPPTSKIVAPSSYCIRRSVTVHFRIIVLLATLATLMAPSFADTQQNDNPPIPGGASLLQVGFSTDGSAKQLVIQTIEAAKNEIRVLAYGLTSKEIARALVEAKKRGVDVRVVVDKSQESERYTSANFLANVGIPVRVDHQHAIQHEKVLVVDGMTVETGSFNFTDSADKRNAENVLVVKNNPELANRYLEEWALHWDHSDELGARY